MNALNDLLMEYMPKICTSQFNRDTENMKGIIASYRNLIDWNEVLECQDLAERISSRYPDCAKCEKMVNELMRFDSWEIMSIDGSVYIHFVDQANLCCDKRKYKGTMLDVSSGWHKC